MTYKSSIIKHIKRFKEDAQQNKQFFKIRAYNSVLKSLEEMQEPINSIEDLQSIKGIGKNIREKIVEIMKLGPDSVNAESQTNTEKDKKIINIDSLQRVHGIGPVKARELVETHGITSIEDLQKESNKHLLNSKQLMGLRYVTDFEKRIPRTEMDKHKTIIQSVLNVIDTKNQYRFEIAGSYRRGAKDSGDIDVLLTGPDHTIMNTILAELRNVKYLHDDFAVGNTKYNGVCKLHRYRTYRRIDIMFTDTLTYPFALMYFTGSKEFNVKLRNIALSQGLSLNEHGFSSSKNKKKNDKIKGKKSEKIVINTIKTEQDIFDYLKTTYVHPTDR